jgi:hypothetical protein
MSGDDCGQSCGTKKWKVIKTVCHPCVCTKITVIRKQFPFGTKFQPDITIICIKNNIRWFGVKKGQG